MAHRKGPRANFMQHTGGAGFRRKCDWSRWVTTDKLLSAVCHHCPDVVLLEWLV
jgi:hypothetical protein